MGYWTSSGNEYKALRAKVTATYGTNCHLCGGPIKPTDLTLDHVIPRSKHGDNSLENLRPAHRWCNTRRQDRPIARRATPRSSRRW